jgi:SNF2 family DNA or RNA helicase
MALNGRLLKHQREGVKWLLTRERSTEYPGGFLCDEMGLGKTVQLVATMLANPVARTLVIVPKSIVTQWQSEIAKFAPHLSVHLFDGPKRSLAPEAQVTIAPYSVLAQRKGGPLCPLVQVEWGRVILDEGHEIRNPRSKSHVAARILQARIRWIVTGTPIFNSIRDFVTLGAFLGIPKHYIQCYTSDVRTKYLMRRTKQDCVRLSLPPCDIETLELRMNEEEAQLYREVYRRSQETVEEIFAEGKANIHQMELIECLLRVRQVMAWPQLYLDGMAIKDKSDPVAWTGGSVKIETLLRMIGEHPEEKTLVFAQFMGEMDEIHSRLHASGIPVYRIDGSIDTAKRAERIEQFQKSEVRPAPVFLIQIKAGGVGLNLQTATRVYITCPAWNPATEIQAICRAHRNGQTNKVWVKKLIYAEVGNLPSIEQSIIDLQGHKSAVCADVLKDERLRAQLPTALKGGVTARAVRKIFSV